jgi:Ribonucleotide reductase, alpha subunit
LGYFVKDKKIEWDELEKVVKMAVRFLDNVIEVNPYPLEQIRKMVFNTRRIGLGVGGWADMLIKLGIPYDSEEGVRLAKEVMNFIETKAVEASIDLASERGPFPLWPLSIYKDEKPRRNSTVTTIAPTGTISIIAGASSGIEPLFAIAYQHIVKDKHLDRRLSFVNPFFEEMLKEKGVWSQELVDRVIEKGMVRDMEELPEDIKNVFGTAHEINPEWHIRMQAAFQESTENAVSKTINLRHEATVEDVKKAYLLAWNSNCRGITVFRDGSKDAQVLNVGLDKKEEDKKEIWNEKAAIIERPFVAKGATYKLATPVGTAFVTINEDENGQPLEVFINVGKAGSDLTAVAEALGKSYLNCLALTRQYFS